MGAIDFDEARFVEEVVKPVQEGWDPTDNLFRVYQLPIGLTETPTIQRALDLVSQHLTSQRLERVFPSAVARLRAGHAHATEILTSPRLRQEHATTVARSAEQLQATLADRVAGGPGIPPQVVTAIATESRGRHTREEIRHALAELNASEQAPIDLPLPTSPKSWPQIRTALGELGKSSLFDYLQTTDALASVATTEAQLGQRILELRKRRDAASSAELNLIESLRVIVKAGTLVDVLRSELLSELQSKAAYRFPVLLSAAETAEARLRALGITQPPRSVAYAVWCRQRYPEVTGSGGAGWKITKQEALAAKELRRALAAFNSAERLTAAEEKELRALAAKISELDTEVARAADLETTDLEAAARIYLAVGTQMSDAGVAAGLIRCRPLPVRAVTTRLDGSRVSIAWQPSASTVGRLGYTVVRALNHPPIGVADGLQIASDSGGLSLVDDSPPAAQKLHYGVFAVREGVAYSDPVVSEPLVVLPEVRDLQLIPAADAIRATWTAPWEAAAIDVSRRVVGSGVAWSRVASVRRQDFTDPTVTPGLQYEYRVRVRYLLPGGSAAMSTGQIVSGRCQELPVAVSRLDISFDGDDLVASWPVPPAGEVEIRELGAADLPVGGVVPVATLDRVGQSLTGVIVRSRAEIRAQPTYGTGKIVLLAVTLLGDLAAIGPVRVLDRRLRPVTELRATRRGRDVVLTWVWPDEALEVRVLQRTDAAPSGPEDTDSQWHAVSRVAYDSLGAHFTLRPGRNFFAVCTTSSNEDGRSFGPSVNVTVESIEEVQYRIVRAGLRGSRRLLTVGSAAGPELPRMHLVARPRTRPMERTQGHVLVDLPGGAAEFSHEFMIPRDLGRPLHLRLFSLDPGVVLRAERPDQLIVR